MKSPITGKEMTLTKERRSLEFRKETFEIVFHYFKCEDSEEQYTTAVLDEVNLNQVYNQYRDKFNIPFPDEILRIREKYGVSASRMAAILGFGTNSYRQYESGEMPSISNAKLIQLANNPENFIEMVKSYEELDDSLKSKYIQRAKALIEDRNRNTFDLNLKDYLLGNYIADIYSGYRNPSLEKLTEMVVYFSDQIQPFKTKMNKLLFYADFLMFKISCFSISGVRYKAIDMGPVPCNYQSIFEYLVNKDHVSISFTEFPQGFTGEQFLPVKNRFFNSALFSKSELDILEKVSSVFKRMSTSEIIDLSHAEKAWRENEKNKSLISYEYAFDLTQI